MFDFGAEMSVRRLLLWTLRSIDEAPRQEEVVQRLLDGTLSYTWRRIVLDILDRSDSSPAVVSEEALKGWEEQQRATLAVLDVDTIVHERNPAIVLEWAKESEPGLVARLLKETPVVMAVLRSALGYRMSQAFGSAALKRIPQLQWRALLNLFGSEAALKAALGGVLDSTEADPDGTLDQRTQDALDLARRFHSGEIDPLAGSEEESEDE